MEVVSTSCVLAPHGALVSGLVANMCRGLGQTTSWWGPASASLCSGCSLLRIDHRGTSHGTFHGTWDFSMFQIFPNQGASMEASCQQSRTRKGMCTWGERQRCGHLLKEDEEKMSGILYSAVHIFQDDTTKINSGVVPNGGDVFLKPWI